MKRYIAIIEIRDAVLAQDIIRDSFRGETDLDLSTSEEIYFYTDQDREYFLDELAENGVTGIDVEDVTTEPTEACGYDAVLDQKLN